ncbi:MAG: hypothetical protein QXZ17_16170, partial [Nitrososphaerota archaeon]
GYRAILNTGPSFLYGMWNASTINTMSSFSGTVNPPNSFLFMMQGTNFVAAFPNESSAAWIPLQADGTFSFSLPSGHYSYYIVMSGHSPEFLNDTGGGPINLNLQNDSSMGIYTPLFAMGNSQLKYISTSGNGTYGNPFIILNNEPASINPIFAQWNDFGYPTFAGVMIMDTNSYVDLNDLPTFSIQYPVNSPIRAISNYYKLPENNSLNMEFYNTSNLALDRSPSISGWFAPSVSIPYNVLFWNSTASLVVNNTFYSTGDSLGIYNGNGNGNNVIFGNYFLENQTVQENYNFQNNISGAYYPSGLSVFSSGNLIYNNYFDVQNPAISPPYNFYTEKTWHYQNTWNITKEPLSYKRTSYGNEISMSGSVLGTGYQGGNYWYNYNGQTPFFNNFGYIAYGGDYLPLDFTQHIITFYETSLPPNTEWAVFASNTSTPYLNVYSFTNGNYTELYLVNGTYSVSTVYFNSTGYGFSGPSFTVNVTINASVLVPFGYYINFEESGLPPGTEWSVVLDGQSETSTTNMITVQELNGSYQYYIQTVTLNTTLPGQTLEYTATPYSGKVSVDGNNVNINVIFTPTTMFTYKFSNLTTKLSQEIGKSISSYPVVVPYKGNITVYGFNTKGITVFTENPNFANIRNRIFLNAAVIYAYPPNYIILNNGILIEYLEYNSTTGAFKSYYILYNATSSINVSANFTQLGAFSQTLGREGNILFMMSIVNGEPTISEFNSTTLEFEKNLTAVIPSNVSLFFSSSNGDNVIFYGSEGNATSAIPYLALFNVSTNKYFSINTNMKFTQNVVAYLTSGLFDGGNFYFSGVNYNYSSNSSSPILISYNPSTNETSNI